MSILALCFPAFIMGLLGGAHCVTMCGGIMGAFNTAIRESSNTKPWFFIGLFNVGRMVSYVVIATMFYALIAASTQYFSWQIARPLAGIFLIALGFYLADWWRGLVYLEKIIATQLIYLLVSIFNQLI